MKEKLSPPILHTRLYPPPCHSFINLPFPFPQSVIFPEANLSSLARLQALAEGCRLGRLHYLTPCSKAAQIAINRGRQGEITRHFTDLPIDAGRVKRQLLGFRLENVLMKISKGRDKGTCHISRNDTAFKYRKQGGQRASPLLRPVETFSERCYQMESERFPQESNAAAGRVAPAAEPETTATTCCDLTYLASEFLKTWES